jgi:hypothetical protein
VRLKTCLELKLQSLPKLVAETFRYSAALSQPIGMLGGFRCRRCGRTSSPRNGSSLRPNGPSVPRSWPPSARHKPCRPLWKLVPFAPAMRARLRSEVMRFPANTSEPSAVRVCPNKFPALSCEVHPTRSVKHLWRCVEGFGFHEVIVDGPDHSCIALLPDAQVAKILAVYKERQNALSVDHRIAQVTIFKNHGVEAGASQPHPALPVDCDSGNSEPGTAPSPRGSPSL